ncbi:urokinase plasminogen activator surface receptor-like [Synchiropus picturatus]
MHLLLMIVGVGLLAPALSLTCYQCASESCAGSETQECSSPEQRCSAVSAVIRAPGMAEQRQHNKGCAPPEHCVEKSFSTRDTRSAINVQCCSTDLCNSRPAPEPSSSPNGRKCYQCDGTSCNATMDCLGSEDSCFTSTEKYGDKKTDKGCISKSMCDAGESPSHMVYKCCQGDRCNGAVGISAALLLLAAPLLTRLIL